jgi:serine/tyrosine/threonine adenylyltransferase
VPLSAHLQPAAATPALGEGFFDAVEPARFPRAVLRYRNQPWAERVGLGELSPAEWIDRFARFEPIAGSLPVPLALRYHGHQFQTYNAALGDGRGFLYAQLRDPLDGRLLDLGTKGSGRTPWSRSADGRLTLKGGVREALATEMLEALGVYTSRTFSVIETGEMLTRGDEPSPTRSSVLVRLSHGHVRFGSFQRHAHAGDADRLRRLLAFSIEHYFPALAAIPPAEQPARFLREVARRSAKLVASWMAAGFVHGVLNTDNMNVTGESFDYGPYRFVPRYDPRFVAAYFDETGLYAFGRQTEILFWNLERLADALSPLAPRGSLRGELVDFETRAMRLFHLAFLDRLGVAAVDPILDSLLVSRCVCFLGDSGAGYDRFFFDWYGGLASESRAMSGPAASFYTGEKWSAVRRTLEGRAPTHPGRLADPYFAGEAPCSLLIDEIEAIWKPIAEDDDWRLFEAKIASIRRMARVFDRGPHRIEDPSPPA